MVSDKTYSVLKWLVQIVLPALGALYFGLGQIWGFPRIEDVVGSFAVVAAFFGSVLGLSAKTYNGSDARFQGSMDLELDPGGIRNYVLSLDTEPESLETMDSVTFKVNKSHQ
jgi:hypothetical protein